MKEGGLLEVLWIWLQKSLMIFYMSHKNEIDDHINNIKESGDYNDLETRLAWDIARALRYWEWMPKDEQGYVGGTDAQCTTLFKQALRKSEIPY